MKKYHYQSRPSRNIKDAIKERQAIKKSYLSAVILRGNLLGNTTPESMLSISKIEKAGEGTGGRGKGKIKMVTLSAKSHFYDPREAIQIAIADAMNPDRSPAKVKSLMDMTSDEKKMLEEKYNAKIKVTA